MGYSQERRRYTNMPRREHDPTSPPHQTTAVLDPMLVPRSPGVIYTSRFGHLVVTPDVCLNRRRLPDGDIFDLAIEPGVAVPRDAIQFRLRTQAGMWFKGIEFYDRSGEAGRLEVNAGPGTTSPLLMSRDELRGCTLVFVKAKCCGIHTAVYEIPGTSFEDQGYLGKAMTFDWIVD